MKLLTKEQQKSYNNAKICYICIEKFKNKYLKDKKYCKVKDHYHFTGEYRGAMHSICNLKYSVSKTIRIAFHNGSNYDYHFIIKKSVEELKIQFTCLGKKTVKYITFTVRIRKEVTRIDKNEEEVTKNISYILQLIDSARLMAAHNQILSIIFLMEFIELNVITDTMIKNAKLEELNINIATTIEYNCLCCKNNYQQKV